MILCGVWASSFTDSSGEILSIKNADVSSIPGDAVYNWDHKSDNSTQIVGKLLKAKKIFSTKDCENDYEKRAWEKLKVPIIYGYGELIDGHSGAEDIKAMALYDEKNKYKENYIPFIGFSVEGANLEKEKNIITHSVIRSISITPKPCNKVCWGEIYYGNDFDYIKPSKSQNLPLPSFLKKGENLEQAYLNRAEEILALYKAEIPDSETLLGKTKSGKSVFSQAKPNEYEKEFSHQDHKDAMNLHYNKALETSSPTAKNRHLILASSHQRAMIRKEPKTKTIAPIKPLPQKIAITKSSQKSNSLKKKEKDQALKILMKKYESEMEEAQELFKNDKENLELWLDKKLPSLNKIEKKAFFKIINFYRLKKAQNALS
jgi:hypothetical protein